MVEITMQVTDELAYRIQPMRVWLPLILELSLAGFQTPAVQTISEIGSGYIVSDTSEQQSLTLSLHHLLFYHYPEIIDFLSTSPSSDEVMAYTVSERGQDRLRRLLTLNEAGMLSLKEQAELDELEHIEHIMILLKAQSQRPLMQVI